MANPKERSVDVYDEKGERILQQLGLTEQQKEKEEKQANKAPVKQIAVLQKLQEKKPRKAVPAMDDEPEMSRGLGR